MSLENSRASDDAAFRDYVLARGTALLRIAVMLTGNRADAEDLVQAALANTYLAWHKINDHAALDAYVRRAMINTHISWWRRRKLEEFPTDELPDQAVADPATATSPRWSGTPWTGCRSGCAPRSCSGTSRT